MELNKFVAIFQEKANQGYGLHDVSVVLKDDNTHKEIKDFEIDFDISTENFLLFLRNSYYILIK